MRNAHRQYYLTPLLLALLSGCGGSDDNAPPPTPTQASPSALSVAASTPHEANANAMEALKQAQQMEQALQDSADRRQREMDAQGR